MTPLARLKDDRARTKNNKFSVVFSLVRADDLAKALAVCEAAIDLTRDREPLDNALAELTKETT